MSLWRLFTYAAPYRWRLAPVALLMLVESLATLAVPWLAGRLTGDLIDGGANPGALLGTILLVLVLIAALRIATGWLSGATSTRLLADLRLMLHDHLQRLPLRFHQEHRQGDLLALMTYEISRLSNFLTGTLIGILPLLVTALGAMILMFRIHPGLAVMVPLLVPGFYLILKVIGRRLRGLARQIQTAEADVVGIAEEHLSMLPAIKTFTREEAESRRYAARIRHSEALTLREVRIYALLDPLIQLAAAAAAVVLLTLAGGSLDSGAMSPADLFSFLLYAALLTRPVAALANLYGQFQSARGTLARLQHVLDTPVEPGYSAPGTLPAPQGRIEFRGVSFAYPDRPGTLHDLTLTIAAGETVALTGANGAGKSTLISLLLRLHDPDHGQILFDDQDIAGVGLAALRGRIGLVPQRALLFNGTIRDNIGFGLEGASAAQIEAAARLAQAHDFITALPHSYDTVVGDHGVRLSGGQRQRVALARALVKDPPVLILDEATSMYDLEGESAFVEACAGALADRTVILITHRPATLALADRILHLANGRIISETAEGQGT